MPDVPGELSSALTIGALLLLFVFSWIAVGPMPVVARWMARLCLIGLAMLPFIMISTFDVPRSPPKSAGAPPPPVVAEGPKDSEPRPPITSELPPGELSSPAPAPSVPPPSAEAPPSLPPELEQAPAPGAPPPPAAPAPKPAPPAVEEPTRGLGSPPTSTAESETDGAVKPKPDDMAEPAPPPPPAPAPGAAPEADKTDWDVVPVFFGTDRAESPNDKRLDYGADRGRKLTMGRALVTVPKAHEVPAIERPWAIRIPYFGITLYEEAEDPKKHFTMQELKRLSKEEFLALVRERLAKSAAFKDHALVFVHGFNTMFDNAVYRTAQIAYDLKFDGAPFLYSWPSGGGVASYTYDRESAGQAVPYMREFLDMVVKETGAKSVSVIAHSMGNQPTLQVLKDIKSSSPPGVVISQIILAAPDVDRDNFENIAKDIQGLANGITLYASSSDKALNVSRRFHGGVPRAGDVPATGPLVVPGIDTIDVTAASTDSLGLNHSGYAENNALLNDIQLLIQTGERPPEKRIPILERVPGPKGDYWRYPVKP